MKEMGGAGAHRFEGVCRIPQKIVLRQLIQFVTCISISASVLFIMAGLARAEKPVVNVKRGVSLPPFEVFLNQPGSAAVRYDYSQARYTVVLGVATWSQRARELATFFRDKQSILKQRNVAIVGAFTHDSEEDILKFREELKIDYFLSRVSLDFVSQMLNPKIPTIWIADHAGQIVYRVVRPMPQGVEHSYQLLRSWTDF